MMSLSSRLPTFIIPGAGKAGTTYVADILSMHDEIFIPVFKEPAFFSLIKKYGNYERGLNFYSKNFIAHKGERHIGEASTIYLTDPVSPALIKKHIPHCKLIFIFRNPVDRLYSNYWQHIKAGYKMPPFDDFIKTRCQEFSEMFQYGLYDLHLTRYLDHFERNSMLFMLYDDLTNDKLAFFNNITDFLLVKRFSEEQFDAILKKRSNVSGIPKSRVFSQLLRNESLTQYIKLAAPSSSIIPLKKILIKLRALNLKEVKYPDMSNDSRMVLLSLYSDSIHRLEDLLEVETGWLTKR